MMRGFFPSKLRTSNFNFMLQMSAQFKSSFMQSVTDSTLSSSRHQAAQWLHAVMQC
jgi:hypothetical protein